MLDSAATSAKPASRQDRTEHAEPPTRAEKSKSAKSVDDRPADIKPAGDSGAIKKDKTADSVDGAEAASESEDGKASDANSGSSADAAEASSDADKPAPDQAQAAAVDIMMADGVAPAASDNPAVTTAPIAVVAPTLPLPVASADAGTAEAGAVAASPAVEGQRVASGPAPKNLQKPTQGQTEAQGGKAADSQDASAKGVSPTEPQAEAPRIDAATDGKPRAGDDKAVAEFDRAFADLTAKLSDAPAPNRGDGASAASSTDAGQPTGALIQSSAANAPTATAPASVQAQSPAATVPFAGLAVEIASQAHAGKNHFEIRLDPPELGRIDVKLDVDRDGNVAARLIVDRSDTLDLLKRDASALERALQQAGLKTSDQGLDFSLRQHAFTEHDATAQNSARLVVPDDNTAPLEALRQGYGRLLGLGGGLDIKV